MEEDGIPEDVRELLFEHIDTVAQLEILLLLHGSAPECWSAERVSQVLGIDRTSALLRLTDLSERGFFGAAADGTEPAWLYAPASPALEAFVAGLARAYKERRVTIISLIFSRPPDPLRHFSNAFKLRKPKDRKD